MKTAALRVGMLVGLLALGLAGCDKGTKPAASSGNSGGGGGNGGAAVALPAGLLLTASPEGGKPPEEAKKAAKVGETIVLSGRVGGSDEPFVAGRAVFVLMGPGIKSCADSGDDHCKTPWDYCCETPDDIAKHAATIQIVDAEGKPLKANVKGQGGIKEMSSLVVVGKVHKIEGETLIVNATGIFVAKQ